MKKAAKNTTTTPKGEKVSYTLTQLDGLEFLTICKGLSLLADDKTAQALLKTLRGIDSETLYQNRDTGEILSYKEMLKQWAEEYDGDDETNALGWAEQYKALN